MEVTFRPSDMTTRGREAYNNCKKFHPSHLSYNKQIYYNKADKVFWTELKEGGIASEMERVK
jgi:hypothetical protein